MVDLGVIGDVVNTAVGFSPQAIIGGILGGVARVVPEIFKIFTAKADRKHELEMRKLDWEISKSTSEQKIREMDKTIEGDFTSKGLDAFVEAVKNQSTPIGLTGNKYIDFLNTIINFVSMTVRPTLTYWWMSLYSLYKYACYDVLIKAGSTHSNAVIALWTPDDVTILSGIVNFFFIGRVFDKFKK